MKWNKTVEKHPVSGVIHFTDYMAKGIHQPWVTFRCIDSFKGNYQLKKEHDGTITVIGHFSNLNKAKRVAKLIDEG